MIAELLRQVPVESIVYPYGSRVYGTASEDSDYDYQIVINDKDFKKEDWVNKLKTRNLDLHVWSQSQWIEALNDQRVYAMECVYLPYSEIPRHNLNFHFQISKAKLRDEFSRVASNSWVKAKKKLIVEADYNERIAKKSIFHSFRILDFGRQIATKNRIVDYNSMNDIYDEIMATPADWDAIDATFRGRHNALASAFREACPKAPK